MLSTKEKKNCVEEICQRHKAEGQCQHKEHWELKGIRWPQMTNMKQISVNKVQRLNLETAKNNLSCK